MYEVVYVPEENWLKIREEFIQQNGLKQGMLESIQQKILLEPSCRAMELLQGSGRNY